jgi:succinate dehydrogenase / fumarate reductase cytochrome b subunit
MSIMQDSREATMHGRRTDGAPVRRPLSPHLQVYDMMQLTSLLSILHRATGVAWTIGSAFIVWWLVAAAAGPDSFDTVQWVFGSFLGVIHTLTGIRHLAWDAGFGYDIPTTYRTGRAVLVGTAVLTLLTWLLMLLSW